MAGPEPASMPGNVPPPQFAGGAMVPTAGPGPGPGASKPPAVPRTSGSAPAKWKKPKAHVNHVMKDDLPDDIDGFKVSALAGYCASETHLICITESTSSPHPYLVDPR